MSGVFSFFASLSGKLVEEVLVGVYFCSWKTDPDFIAYVFQLMTESLVTVFHGFSS